MSGSLQHDVAALATDAGRMVGTPGHEAAASYLLGRMAEVGLEGYGGLFTHAYRVGTTHFTNLVGQLPGSDPSLPPLLLGAHYDTCGALPGADDNAAAVAIVLAVAERLRYKSLERPLLFAFFDAEEPPFFHSPAMGSTYFYHHQRTEEVHAALILDLVGHDVPVPGLEDLLFLTGMESDPKFPAILERCAPTKGVRTVASLNRYVGDMSDHHVFRLHGRPYLFLTCGRWPHYHRASDTPDRLNYEKMAAVADFLNRAERRCGGDRARGTVRGLRLDRSGAAPYARSASAVRPDTRLGALLSEGHRADRRAVHGTLSAVEHARRTTALSFAEGSRRLRLGAGSSNSVRG